MSIIKLENFLYEYEKTTCSGSLHNSTFAQNSVTTHKVFSLMSYSLIRIGEVKIWV
ncbi:hypothetical protein Hanom_Chr05g00406901 [Helianthus anomalus]